MTYKTFQDGEVFSAADAQLLMDQSIIILPTKTALNTIPTPDPGQVVFIEDLDVYLRRTPGAWRCLTDYVILASAIIRDQLPAPHVGLIVRSRDTGQEDRWDGTAWVPWTTPWQTLNLNPAAAWVNHSVGFGNARYRLHQGVVYVEGLLKNGATSPGNIIATLPAGFRPAPTPAPAIALLMGQLCSTPTTTTPCYLELRSNGEIVTGAGVQNAWLSVQFSFKAA